MNLPEKHCWAEISLNAIKNNYNFIKNSFEIDVTRIRSICAGHVDKL